MEIKTQWGIPIVMASNIFPYLKSVGIQPWPQIEPTVSLDEYLGRDLTDLQKNELRFAPKTEVMFLQQPDGKSFTGFRTALKPWATTFVLLPGGFVPIVAEWKHGTECISLAPPSGVLSKNDQGSMYLCAQREFQEETGIQIQTPIELGDPNGISLGGRGSTQRFFPFLGYAVESIYPGPTKLDNTEHIKLVLIPLDEWMEMISGGMVTEACAIITTFLALQRIGKLIIK